MSALRSALFDWDTDRLLVIVSVGFATYISLNTTDDNAIQLVMIVVISVIFVEVSRRIHDFIKNRAL
jgi:hypothetical protein